MTDQNIQLQYMTFHKESALYWNNLANQRQFELAKQLLTIGAVLLTISATAIVTIRGINFQSQPLQSYSLLLSWIFFLFSIICGFKQLINDASYFNYLSNDESTRENKFAVLPFDRAKQEIESMKPTNSRGDEKWLLLQHVFFYLGLIFITLSAFFILYFKT
ncbi:MAG TPA: hypothetical protein VJH96_00870 [Patescibacteria group bacterium]|nr:hypothetical protein [Patescibacteria group bacterium]